MSPRLGYITVGTEDEAKRIARTLLDERLIACANILPGVTSLYRWDGRVAEDREVVLIVKTRSGLVSAMTERVQALHSYDCPCVVSLPIEDGNPAFIDWIRAETRRG